MPTVALATRSGARTSVAGANGWKMASPTCSRAVINVAAVEAYSTTLLLRG